MTSSRLYMSLDHVDGEEDRKSSRKPIFNKKYIIATASVCIIILFALFGTTLISKSTQTNLSSHSNNLNEKSKSIAPVTSITTPKSKTQSTSINFSFNRVGYPLLPYFDKTVQSFLTYTFLSSYVAVIEPSVPMELSLYGESTSIFEYVICPLNSYSGSNACVSSSTRYISSNSYVSKSFQINCIPHEKYSVTVKELDPNGFLISQVEETAICLLVRREIRSLNSDDLNTFITASHALWEYSDEEGEAVYGSDFKSNSYLLLFHYFNAALQDQDHIHEGNGFLLQHLKMTNIFENSIRAVNPAVNLPYWDFTIDEIQGKGATDSYIMQPHIYGSMKQPKDVTNGFTYHDDSILDAAIPDGLWKNLKTEMNTKFEDLKYGYGYLRAPWNLNPSPYISRFPFEFNDTILLPSCPSHYEILQYDDMMDFFFKMQLTPHGATHAALGGIYGCDMFDPLVESGHIYSKAAANEICSLWFTYTKEFYRYNYLTPEKNCVVNSENIQESACGFICNSKTTTSMTARLFRLQSRNIDTSKSDAQEVWTDFICNGSGAKIFAGDHLESASPADPTFWVIHPTLERLLHAKLMSGGFANEEWASDVKNDYVCDKAKCYDSSTGVFDYYESCCYGHFENSQLLDALSGDRNTYFGLTNGDVLKATDPRRTDYSMPYIYDSFTWDHCLENMSSMLNNLLTKKKESTIYTTPKELSGSATDLSSPM
eukprot:gene4980-6963_t